jgi:hypothetical protein
MLFIEVEALFDTASDASTKLSAYCPTTVAADWVEIATGIARVRFLFQKMRQTDIECHSTLSTLELPSTCILYFLCHFTMNQTSNIIFKDNKIHDQTI